jgi:hypothetical protein
LFRVAIALLGLAVFGFSKADAEPTVQITFPQTEHYYTGISRAECTASAGVEQNVDRVYCQLYYYYAGNYTYQYWNWVAKCWQTSPTWDTMTLAEFVAATGVWRHSGPFPEKWDSHTGADRRTYALYARVYDTAGGVGANVNYFYIDNVGPTIRLTVLKKTLQPANGKMVLAAEVSVADACDPAPRVVINVSSSDVVKGGKDKPDWQIVQEGGVWRIWLRAEIAGGHTTRVYTIGVQATDAAGNTVTASDTVTVAKGRGM